MKTIDFCMVAWPRDEFRLQYFEASLKSFREFVTASRHIIRAYVSFETLDVSTENFQSARAVCRKYDVAPTWRAKPPSLGGNQNDALMIGHGEFKLTSQDDWAWNRPIDISPAADILERNCEFALIRFATFYTEFTGFDFENASGQRFEFVKMDGPFPYGDQPHLRRADFATRKSQTGGEPIGFYHHSETGDYATPENEMAHRLITNGWKIAAYHPNVVDHCGSMSSAPDRRPQTV